MAKSLTTALLCALAVLAADLVFRVSLLEYLRPVVSAPSHQAILQAPVELRWSGPERMHVHLAIAGGESRDLGVQSSPFEIPATYFPRDGGYEVSVQALQLGAWIRAERIFQVHAEISEPDPIQEATPEPAPTGLRDLSRALEAARAARNRSQDRVRFLREENRSIHSENERLSKELETAYTSQDEDAERLDDLEEQLGQSSEETRILAEALAALRLRLSRVVDCTVWGYYGGYPVHGSSGARRTVVVSDAGGEVFRLPQTCNTFRQSDSTASSLCFCVGNSWGG